MALNLSWSYVPSKTGKPRYAQIDKCEQWKNGWAAIPGSTRDCIKPAILIREYKWSELTDEQRAGIYNHTLLYTSNIVGNPTGPGRKDENRFIIQKQIGNFIIKYNGGSFDLFINTGNCGDQHIIRNRPLKSPVKMVAWLKHFAQYLIDEPEELQKIIDNPVLVEKHEIFTKDATEEIKGKPEYKPANQDPFSGLKPFYVTSHYSVYEVPA